MIELLTPPEQRLRGGAGIPSAVRFGGNGRVRRI